MNKRKILMSNEASYLFSGYSKYGREVLARLNKTGKYEIGEFATYGSLEDHRSPSVPWKFYPNVPAEDDEQGRKEYNSHALNQFGKWRFDRVLLDFKPDIVWDIRDFWMMGYEYNSPLRDYYNWSIMPTVDSAPQQPEWVHVFSTADDVFTYSDWALDILKNNSSKLLNLHKSAPPGVDYDTFTPVVNKAKHKEACGLFGTAKIIGTVMRNQKRKLFPDLFIGFRKYLDKCKELGKDELANNTYFYMHTSYPDVGYNIPAMLKEQGLGNKVLFTYLCKKTGKWFPSFYQGPNAYSPFSGEISAVMPNVVNGISEQSLAQIIGLFDVYVQYAICEGFGMPQVEAASCGVPVMSVDYSAMSDVVRKLKGYPIKVKKLFREMETDAYRANPDNDDLCEKLVSFFSKPESVRLRKGFEARKAVLKHYTWDQTAKIWENHFDSIELKGLQGKWNQPPRMVNEDYVPQQGTTNENFVNEAFSSILNGRHYQYFKMEALKNIMDGARFEGKKWNPYSRKTLEKTLKMMASNINQCEAARCGLVDIGMPDFIRYANRR
jgi:glycosyltransferase involved in cell wall biosynthesis